MRLEVYTGRKERSCMDENLNRLLLLPCSVRVGVGVEIQNDGMIEE